MLLAPVFTCPTNLRDRDIVSSRRMHDESGKCSRAPRHEESPLLSFARILQ